MSICNLILLSDCYWSYHIVKRKVVCGSDSTIHLGLCSIKANAIADSFGRCVIWLEYLSQYHRFDIGNRFSGFLFGLPELQNPPSFSPLYILLFVCNMFYHQGIYVVFFACLFVNQHFFFDHEFVDTSVAIAMQAFQFRFDAFVLGNTPAFPAT